MDIREELAKIIREALESTIEAKDRISKENDEAAREEGQTKDHLQLHPQTIKEPDLE